MTFTPKVTLLQKDCTKQKNKKKDIENPEVKKLIKTQLKNNINIEKLDNNNYLELFILDKLLKQKNSILLYQFRYLNFYTLKYITNNKNILKSPTF